ncbi:hypothetical protein ABH944_003979 [Caballeronia udeis]|jgi:hypothetical protein|uniref:Uncharacterized protein n=1 Tax=Caballeronia udeis TaxID=1232866 RepID=A0ABW8MIT3_9BURK
MDVIDTNVDLRSHDYKRLYLDDVMGSRGLIVVGVGRGGERGFQMLYRFSDICDRLENQGVNAVFVYRKESARHVFDTTSLFGARFRLKPCLLLDDAGLFFRGSPQDRSLRAVHFNRKMEPIDTAIIPLGKESWDPLLRVFLAQVISGCLH